MAILVSLTSVQSPMHTLLWFTAQPYINLRHVYTQSSALIVTSLLQKESAKFDSFRLGRSEVMAQKLIASDLKLLLWNFTDGY